EAEERHGGAGAAPAPAPALHDALARLALSDLDDPEDDDPDPDAVTLLTLHSAKGLEFSDVFLVGLEDGVLPHARSIDDAAAGVGADPLAEERRLFYVGITRAKQRLTLSYCRTRRRGGDVVEALPSRYLEEIPAELLNVKTADRILSEQESRDLKANFFDRMKTMLAE
ncbi:MAG: 3'-5' exonuclease, partial [Longimicrobiales bacterium]